MHLGSAEGRLATDLSLLPFHVAGLAAHGSPILSSRANAAIERVFADLLRTRGFECPIIVSVTPKLPTPIPRALRIFFRLPLRVLDEMNFRTSSADWAREDKSSCCRA